MAHLRLPAGTDIAEMALFDVDALPSKHAANEAQIEELASRSQLIRFPTFADGGYLLHIFLNEEIPPAIRRYCLDEDKLEGHFSSMSGHIAFGGVESAFREFKPNPNIRADGTIDPGTYAYTAYRTEFPEEVVTRASQIERTTSETWLDRGPLIAVLFTIGSAVSLSVLQHFFLAGATLIAGYFIANWLGRHPEYLALQARRSEAQLDFPSIVVLLRR